MAGGAPTVTTICEVVLPDAFVAVSVYVAVEAGAVSVVMTPEPATSVIDVKSVVVVPSLMVTLFAAVPCPATFHRNCSGCPASAVVSSTVNELTAGGAFTKTV